MIPPFGGYERDPRPDDLLRWAMANNLSCLSDYNACQAKYRRAAREDAERRRLDPRTIRRQHHDGPATQERVT